MSQAPTLIRLSNPIARGLLRLGVPMGPNTLLTVRGRTSGVPRTAPVAVAEVDGRMFVLGAYGEVQWVRNLRAAGVAELRLHGRPARVSAVELDRAARDDFYVETLPRYIAGLPLVGRIFARLFFTTVGREILEDPLRAAATKPVFELRVFKELG